MIYQKERLNKINPVVKCLCEIALSKYKKDCIIVEGKRTVERQLELYGKGRSIVECMKYMDYKKAVKYSKPTETQVTWTTNSRHLTGLAVDVVPFYNNKIQWVLDPDLIRIMEMHGFESGSRWKKQDIPHYQIDLPKPLRKTISSYNTTPQLTRCIQSQLVKKGYIIAIDGVFGEQTKQAVKDFKCEHGLYFTPRVTRKAIKLLFL